MRPSIGREVPAVSPACATRYDVGTSMKGEQACRRATHRRSASGPSVDTLEGRVVLSTIAVVNKSNTTVFVSEETHHPGAAGLVTIFPGTSGDGW